MGESSFVQINSSVADVAGAAANLASLGESLSSDMATLLGAVESLEGAHVWGGDDFAGKFLDNGEGGYHHPVNGKPTAEAVKDMTRYRGSGEDNTLGGALSNLGNSVANGLLDVADTDSSSAAGFQSI